MNIVILEMIADQREYILRRGGTVEGYVERYGSMDDRKHEGPGGELMFAQDLTELVWMVLYAKGKITDPKAVHECVVSILREFSQ